MLSPDAKFALRFGGALIVGGNLAIYLFLTYCPQTVDAIGGWLARVL